MHPVKKCVICNGRRANVRLLPCKHIIHGRCYYPWPVTKCNYCEQDVTSVEACDLESFYHNGSVYDPPNNVNSITLIRSGRWSPEETSYARCLIEGFNSGMIPIGEKTNLGGFLCLMLLCNSARLSSKLRTGKKIYILRRSSTVTTRDIHQYHSFQQKLSEAEELFLCLVARTSEVEEAALLSHNIQYQWMRQFMQHAWASQQPVNSPAHLLPISGCALPGSDQADDPHSGTHSFAFSMPPFSNMANITESIFDNDLVIAEEKNNGCLSSTSSMASQKSYDPMIHTNTSVDPGGTNGHFKSHKRDLSAVTSFGESSSVPHNKKPFPSYHSSNRSDTDDCFREVMSFARAVMHEVDGRLTSTLRLGMRAVREVLGLYPNICSLAIARQSSEVLFASAALVTLLENKLTFVSDLECCFVHPEALISALLECREQATSTTKTTTTPAIDNSQSCMAFLHTLPSLLFRHSELTCDCIARVCMCGDLSLAILSFDITKTTAGYNKINNNNNNNNNNPNKYVRRNPATSSQPVMHPHHPFSSDLTTDALDANGSFHNNNHSSTATTSAATAMRPTYGNKTYFAANFNHAAEEYGEADAAGGLPLRHMYISKGPTLTTTTTNNTGVTFCIGSDLTHSNEIRRPPVLSDPSSSSSSSLPYPLEISQHIFDSNEYLSSTAATLFDNSSQINNNNNNNNNNPTRTPTTATTTTNAQMISQVDSRSSLSSASAFTMPDHAYNPPPPPPPPDHIDWCHNNGGHSSSSSSGQYEYESTQGLRRAGEERLGSRTADSAATTTDTTSTHSDLRRLGGPATPPAELLHSVTLFNGSSNNSNSSYNNGIHADGAIASSSSSIVSTSSTVPPLDANTASNSDDYEIIEFDTNSAASTSSGGGSGLQETGRSGRRDKSSAVPCMQYQWLDDLESLLEDQDHDDSTAASQTTSQIPQQQQQQQQCQSTCVYQNNNQDVYSISGTPTTKDSFSNILGKFLRQVPFQLADIWVPVTLSPTCSVLVLGGSACMDESFCRWSAYSKKFYFKPSVGIPGRVLSLSRPEAQTDVASLTQQTFPRVEGARSFGLHASLGVPVRSADGGGMVVVFYSQEAFAASPELVRFTELLLSKWNFKANITLLGES